MLNFHQSLSFLNWLFPLLPVPQDFPARLSHKISHKNFPQDFPQDFPTRISHKNFPQEFPARFSHKIFPQDFPARISHKNFPQDFPELDPDWLAPHHPIPNAKFPPITVFLKLAFSPPPCPTRFSCNIIPQDFPQEFPTRFPTRFSHKNFPQEFSHKNFLQDFPTRFSHKIFPQEFPTRISHKIFLSWILIGWLPITLFQMLNFHQSLSFLNWLFPLFPALQDFPARISCKIFPQDFPELDPDWLAPHHPIPNAKFPPITVFLKLAFSSPPCPARFSCKIFPQDFPTRFSCKIFPQDFPKLDPDWLAPNHPIPNAKFPPITALLNRPTYHKIAKVSPPPFPQILWELQINE